MAPRQVRKAGTGLREMVHRECVRQKRRSEAAMTEIAATTEDSLENRNSPAVLLELKNH